MQINNIRTSIKLTTLYTRNNSFFYNSKFYLTTSILPRTNFIQTKFYLNNSGIRYFSTKDKFTQQLELAQSLQETTGHEHARQLLEPIWANVENLAGHEAARLLVEIVNSAAYALEDFRSIEPIAKILLHRITQTYPDKTNLAISLYAIHPLLSRTQWDVATKPMKSNDYITAGGEDLIGEPHYIRDYLDWTLKEILIDIDNNQSKKIDRPPSSCKAGISISVVALFTVWAELPSSFGYRISVNDISKLIEFVENFKPIPKNDKFCILVSLTALLRHYPNHILWENTSVLFRDFSVVLDDVASSLTVSNAIDLYSDVLYNTAAIGLECQNDSKAYIPNYLASYMSNQTLNLIAKSIQVEGIKGISNNPQLLNFFSTTLSTLMLFKIPRRLKIYSLYLCKATLEKLKYNHTDLESNLLLIDNCSLSLNISANLLEDIIRTTINDSNKNKQLDFSIIDDFIVASAISRKLLERCCSVAAEILENNINTNGKVISNIQDQVNIILKQSERIQNIWINNESKFSTLNLDSSELPYKNITSLKFNTNEMANFINHEAKNLEFIKSTDLHENKELREIKDEQIINESQLNSLETHSILNNKPKFESSSLKNVQLDNKYSDIYTDSKNIKLPLTLKQAIQILNEPSNKYIETLRILRNNI